MWYVFIDGRYADWFDDPQDAASYARDRGGRVVAAADLTEEDEGELIAAWQEARAEV